MNRFVLLAGIMLLVACGASTEEPGTDQSEENVKSAKGSDQEIDPVTGKPVVHTPTPAAACTTCGPVPDPWKWHPPGPPGRSSADHGPEKE
jgi:hypothetical protein